MDSCNDWTRGRCSRGASCRYAHEGAGGGGGGEEVCRDFQKGACTRGGSCRYSHSAGGGAPGGMPPADPWAAAAGGLASSAPGSDPWAAAAQNPAMMAQMMQMYYGAYGGAYGAPAAAASPYGAPGAAASPYGAASKTERPVCKDFQNSTCTRPTCKFVHITTEQQTDMDKVKEKTGLPYTTFCRKFQANECSFNDCKYYHGTRDVENMLFGTGTSGSAGGADYGGAKQSCRDHQNGKCSRGDTCRFSHEAETVPTAAAPADAAASY